MQSGRSALRSISLVQKIVYLRAQGNLKMRCVTIDYDSYVNFYALVGSA